MILGPLLFTHSFGLIGAILSHEIEGHWQLQYSAPGMLDRSDQSSWMREVQAFRVELSNPGRFGLTPGEIQSENSKEDKYYNALTKGNKEMVNSGWYKQL